MTQLNIFEPIEEQIKPPSGNKALYQYGIDGEASDFRAHVTYPIMRVYIFPTAPMVRLIAQPERLNLTLKSVYTSGIETAKGYLVPLSYIEGIHEVVIPPDIWNARHIDKDMLTSTKGLVATAIVVELLYRDMIPLPVSLNLADSKALQVSDRKSVV